MPTLHFNNVRHADLPLHYGKVPPWLYERMALLERAIMEMIIIEYGKDEVLKRMSDPFWFQSLGCVLGMDWHSSGITTSVMGALKKSLNPKFKELGIFIAGGKGKHSRNTPGELHLLADKTGLNGNELVRSSKLAAKVDNNAIQDGFQLYLHNFIVSDTGNWAVIQQGMNDGTGMARRYHWNSASLKSFTNEPHTFIYGKNSGDILNLTHTDAGKSKDGMMEIVQQHPNIIIREMEKLMMPAYHDIRTEDINLKRLGTVLAVAHDKKLRDFDAFLLLEGVGPRSIQSLALVSEIIHGTLTRFSDPARFSFAHGGKDGHPFPVPVTVYDETINIMRSSIEKSKLGYSDKSLAIKNLSYVAQMLEENFVPKKGIDKLIAHERSESYKYGGKTVFGNAKPSKDNNQLSLF